MSSTMTRNSAAVSSSAEHKPILAERFKTKMCQNYEKTGACPYEARCMFAHGPADLRTKHMNLADNLVTEDAIKAFLNSKQTASRDAADGKNSILAERFKTKMCQNYEKQGSCPYEARCMFAHGYHDLRTKEMNLADNLVTEEAIKAFLARQRISAQVDICGEKCSILAERFKTKMCQNFEQTGACPYEHKCMFAHGLEDLRTKEMNLDDGLTTEEAIRDFQHHAATAARDAQRRKKRNEKKKAKAKAVKFARRQELACSKSTTEFIATESGDFASGSASNVDFASFQASPNVQPTSGSDSGRSEAGTELPSAAASPLRVKGDQYRHDPYSPVVIGLPVASRSAVGNLQLPRARQQVEEPVTSQVPPKAVPAAAQPALQSQQRLLRATSALFPLASVLQQIRRQRRATTTDEVDPATTTSIRAPTPGAQAHTILLP